MYTMAWYGKLATTFQNSTFAALTFVAHPFFKPTFLKPTFAAFFSQFEISRGMV